MKTEPMEDATATPPAEDRFLLRKRQVDYEGKYATIYNGLLAV